MDDWLVEVWVLSKDGYLVHTRAKVKARAKETERVFLWVSWREADWGEQRVLEMGLKKEQELEVVWLLLKVQWLEAMREFAKVALKV